MVSLQKNNRSYSKLAQIYNTFENPKIACCREEITIKKILKNDGDINFKIPINSRADSNLIGCTALHIATIHKHTKVFENLLSNGADFTIQNQHRRTILHSTVYELNPNMDIIDDVFSLHLSLADPSNQSDNNGISHFHIACICNRADVVEFFLKNSIPIDIAVNFDSEKFAGFTPLHFAAQSMAMSVTKILLKYNAKLNVKEARGLTPLHILLEQKITMLDDENSQDYKVPRQTMAEIDEVTDMLLDGSEVDDIGLSHFHIACTQRDTSVAEYFLEQDVDINQKVNVDSPIFPGYTALHFAAHCNIDIMIMLLKKKANLFEKDAKGVTPMDIILKNGRYDDIVKLFAHIWKYVTFSEQQVRLVDFIRSAQNVTLLEKYLKNLKNVMTTITYNPAYWAGCTLLHFAVMVCKRCDVIELCMKHGFDNLVDIQDSNGLTPIHLAFRLNKLNILEILMKNCFTSTNLADNEGLTFLHITCAVGKLHYINNFCSTNIEVVYRGKSTYGPVTPGSTALHVAIAMGNTNLASRLLEDGLHLTDKDAENHTPIHRFMQLPDRAEDICKIILNNITDYTIEKYGLTKLHMAVYCEACSIKEYIKEDNVDVVISCNDSSSFLFPYDGCTPLYIAVKKHPSHVKSLLKLGADLLAKNHKGDTPLYAALNKKSIELTLSVIVSELKNNKILQKRMEKETGITMLHIACHMVNIKEVTSLFSHERNINVNSRVKSDCPIWAGCTPLHILLNTIKFHGFQVHFYNILKALLTKGADVSAMDGHGETPIHLALQISTIPETFSVLQLLHTNAQNFDINPADRNGVTHFHAACLANRVDFVKSYVERGVDVNLTIDFFAKKFAGATPLHLAIDHRTEDFVTSETKIKTVDFLLEHGADPNAADDHGNTAFHRVVKLDHSCLIIIENLLAYGASIDVRNIFEETPLEMLLKSKYVSAKAIKLFEKNGCRLNASNPLSGEGYFSMLISHGYHSNYKPISERVMFLRDLAYQCIEESFLVMIDSSDAFMLDEMGRTFIHNLVTTNNAFYIFNFDDLMKTFRLAGVDIDVQDKTGKTALHLAAQFGNFDALCLLLDNGADFNIRDKENKTAFNYAKEYFDETHACSERRCHSRTIAHLVTYVYKLEELKLDIDYNNVYEKNLAITENISWFQSDECKRKAIELINVAKAFVIDDKPPLFVKDFLSETGQGLTSYVFATDLREETVDNFFLNYKGDLRDICMLQYRKTVKRVELVRSIMKSPLAMTHSITVPVHCMQMICQYLSNSDLENYIKATAVLESNAVNVNV